MAQSTIYMRMVLLPVSFDPEALAMALQLADLLRGTWDNQNRYRGRWESVADWLRAEVARELESQS